MVKCWKTGFADSYCKSGSTACQKMKRYSCLKILVLVQLKDPDGIFYLNEMHWWKRRAMAIAVQDKYQGLNQRAIAQRRTPTNTDEHWNPNDRSMAEERKAYWCSWNSGEASWFSGAFRVMQRPELRSRTKTWRRRLSSSARSTQGRRRSEEVRGEVKETLGPIYKANG